MQIPETENALVLRSDFSSDAAWTELQETLRRPQGLFKANCDYLSNRDFEGVEPGSIPSMLRAESRHTFMFIADRRTFAHPDKPLLAVDLFDERMLTFRVALMSLGCVENNLSLGNSDFDDFVNSLDEDGVFRFSWPE